MMASIRLKSAVVAALAMLAIAGPAFADRDKWDDGPGHGDKRDRGHEDRRDDRHDDRRYEERREYRGERHEDRHFHDHDRVVIHDYYEHEYSRGFCPPGLAKKHNGCMPPGQARRWEIGRPLPRDVVYYDLPPSVVIELGPPPPRHRYVRVASDILLIAIGTGMVVDAIDDLGR
ncbi:RcnB family protein [Novimethylophilus kurashikiensis]|nr:RcnB family protein [Novimethylophilus kurashikiensis]